MTGINSPLPVIVLNANVLNTPNKRQTLGRIDFLNDPTL